MSRQDREKKTTRDGSQEEADAGKEPRERCVFSSKPLKDSKQEYLMI